MKKKIVLIRDNDNGSGKWGFLCVSEGNLLLYDKLLQLPIGHLISCQQNMLMLLQINRFMVSDMYPVYLSHIYFGCNNLCYLATDLTQHKWKCTPYVSFSVDTKALGITRLIH